MLRTLHHLSIIIISLCLSALVVNAQTIRYVKPTATGTGDGLSWANASGNLQTMINASAANDEVWVAAGTYKPTTGTNRGISFRMKNGVTIKGGFPNTGNPTISDRNWLTNISTLSGEIGNPSINYDNTYHVINNIFTVSTVLNETAILDGFKISDGNASANGAYDEAFGGGMINYYSKPTILNCTFSNNGASNGGGGIYYIDSFSEGSVINNCTFSNNYNTFGNGGAIYCSYATLINCKFFNNIAAWEGL